MPGKRPYPGNRSRGGRGGGRPKKVKRSKNFWKQRKTAEIAPVPVSEDETSSSGEEVDSEDEDHEGGDDYEQFMNAFGQEASKKAKVAVESSSEDGDSEEEEDGTDGTDDEEDDVELGEEEEEEDQDEEEESSEESDNSEDQSEDESEDETIHEEDQEQEEEEEEEECQADPFNVRYDQCLPGDVKEAIVEGDYAKAVETPFNHLGKLFVQIPNWKPPTVKAKSKSKKAALTLLDDEAKDTLGEERQANLIRNTFQTSQKSDGSGLGVAYVKQQLMRHLRKANPASLYSKQDLSPFQQELMEVLGSYKDLSFSERTGERAEEARLVYALHALNHVMKTRSKILANNAKVSKKGDQDSQEVSNLRDQGLCRPKVLIIVPFRESARLIVNLMCKLLFGDDKGGKVANINRFKEEFGNGEEDVRKGNKPDDFYETFAGNVDDGFRIGMAVTRKSLKLYTDFYSSDIIVASPLGLRMTMGSAEDGDGMDHDFLSSVEVLVVDQVNVLAMQNWEHVTHVFDHLNLQPARSHGADFTRVRMWALEGDSAHFRQTVLFSDCYMPEMNSILNRQCSNYMGRLRTVQDVPGCGQVSRVVVRVPIVFRRVDCQSLVSSPDERFDNFEAKVMPEYKKDTMFHTCVFVPSYFDFVRVRNWFDKSDLDFLEVCEYTKDKDVAKARDHFFHGDTHFLLYTERSHFYRRFNMKGIRHLILYQLPQHPKFFSELCNMMQASNQNRKADGGGHLTVTVLYTKYDAQRLAAAVGSSRARTMITGEKNVHMFVAGS